MWIKNAQEVISKASNPITKELRQTGLIILEQMYSQLQSSVLLKEKLRLEGDDLYVGHSIVHLQDYDEILVVGGGKAVVGMIKALEECFPDPDREFTGVVSVPDSIIMEEGVSSEIALRKASHPIPDARGQRATEEMANLLRAATDKTLVFFLLSGGGSALMPLPVEGINLEVKLLASKLLLKSGASISEINTVRKHLSDWKGGHAAKLAHPATVVSLILSDVIGDRLDVIASGPTVPDNSTYPDARNVLQTYGLWDKVDETIRKRINLGVRGHIPDTPKIGDVAFRNSITELIGNNRSATNIVTRVGQELGFKVMVLTNHMEGEAREVGRFVGAGALQIERFNEPISSPCVVVLGGETTVTVEGNGYGGRNQELAFASSQVLSGTKNTAIISVSSDGIDGVTDAAGAIVDGDTKANLSQEGFNFEQTLKQNDTGTALSRIGNNLITGSTGTNVADLVLIISKNKFQ